MSLGNDASSMMGPVNVLVSITPELEVQEEKKVKIGTTDLRVENVGERSHSPLTQQAQQVSPPSWVL